MLKASRQVALKCFLWVQKLCAKHPGAFKTSGLCNWQRTLNQGHYMSTKKVRNENEAHLMSKDFIDFQTFSNFWRIFEFFIMLKVLSQVALKNFLWLQKLCSKHPAASKTPGLCNARWIKVTACVEKKLRNENGALLIGNDFNDFQTFWEF